MNCPACSKLLTQIDVSGVTVDICKGGCAGIWFDNYEFKKFDEPHESEGEVLLEIETASNVRVDHTERRKCPKCDDITMMRRFFSTKKEVEIDECAGCAGIWLDTGELSKLRQLFDSEEEKRDAANEVFEDLFGARLAKLSQESRDDRDKARRIANMFRFICPSYYISGNQGWGAF